MAYGASIVCQISKRFCHCTLCHQWCTHNVNFLPFLCLYHISFVCCIAYCIKSLWNLIFLSVWVWVSVTHLPVLSSVEEVTSQYWFVHLYSYILSEFNQHSVKETFISLTSSFRFLWNPGFGVNANIHQWRPLWLPVRQQKTVIIRDYWSSTRAHLFGWPRFRDQLFTRSTRGCDWLKDWALSGMQTSRSSQSEAFSFLVSGTSDAGWPDFW